MFRKKIHRVLLIFLILITCLGNTSAVFAEAGTAVGAQSDSPGVKGQKPLGYLGTFVVNGEKLDNATAVPINPRLKVEFDKNVVNSLIWTNNRQCFSLKSGDNESVPINVTKIDDTVDPTQRQYIFVHPASPLKQGTSYQLIISPNLLAKNGLSLGNGGVTVAFKTTGEATQQAPETTALPATQPENQPAATAVTPTSSTIPAKEDSTNGKTTSPNVVEANPSSTTDQTKPSDSSDMQKQSKETETITPDNTTNSKPTTNGHATSPSISQSSNEKGNGISTTTLIAIIGAVLVAAWIMIEIILRKKRNK